MYSSKKTTKEVITIAGNRPLLLDEPQAVWFVREGQADVYAVPLQDGMPAGRRIFLFRAEMGQALFGMEPETAGAGTGLLVSGTPGTTLGRRQRDRLLERAREKQNPMLAEPAAYLVESWAMGLWKGVIREAPPSDFYRLEPGETVELPDGACGRPAGDIVWARINSGMSMVAGRAEMIMEAGSAFVPLTGHTWLEMPTEGSLTLADTMSLVDLSVDDSGMPLWQSLEFFHHLALMSFLVNREQMEKAEKDQLKQVLQHDRVLLQKAFLSLQEALHLSGERSAEKWDDPLMEALRLVGSQMNITIKPPPGWVLKGKKSVDEVVRSVAQSSRIRYRQVELKGRWWQGDHGPLIAFGRNDNRPLALLQVSEKKYRLCDPQAGSSERSEAGTIVDEETAAAINPVAYMFYPALPDRQLSVRDLLSFMRRNTWKKDIMLLVLMGMAGGLMGLVIPYMTGILFDQIIPAADRTGLIYFTQFLLVSTIAVFIFNITRAVAMLRLETRMDTFLQAAVWDRLLKLPVNFFRSFTAGDLAQRAMGINTMRRLISGVTMTTVFSAVFSLFNLVLLFYYNAGLAWIALGLVLVAVFFTVFFSYLSIRYKRETMQLNGRIAGLLLQILGGITRFRMAGAENRAYYLWAREFGEQRNKSVRQQVIGNYLNVFSTVYPVLASVIIFGAVIYSDRGLSGDFSPGIFLAFNAAFAGLLAALMVVSREMTSLMEVVPLYERIKPLLETLPEGDESPGDPGELKGAVEAGNISFRYDSLGPFILDNVNLKIEPGQFVAVVGASGSGKSTLLRVLMGFEKPESGTVYYDNQDLNILDLHYLRNQLGVVLQNDKLIQGSIFENIAGVANINLDDAWKAARMAGIEEEIRQMPMGMHTYIAEGGTTISGGQRQRILIARAIARKPRIIFFDEATSALDNKNQAVVSRSLEELKASRLVIAHRLSTVENADVIYVMDKGRIAESGSYDELMQKGGLFSELAKRQIA